MTRVGIFIFPEVEVLDFCGPFEVFSVTRLTPSRRRDDPAPFEVCTIAESLELVKATGGLQVMPSHSFESCPALDLLVVPGGWGTREQVKNLRVVNWIGQQAKVAAVVASVCTGSFLLAEASLLTGQSATTHRGSLDRFASSYPSVRVDRERQVVRAGKVMTSAGISAGIDLSLFLVADLLGETVARETAAHMEYPYPESEFRRVPVS
jgi:transcriptional regulator GlxA family with amidase domain